MKSPFLLAVRGDQREVARIATTLRVMGWRVRRGFEPAEPDADVCAGLIRHSDDAAAATLAAVRGAGLVAGLAADEATERMFLDDLRRLGQLTVVAEGADPGPLPLSREQETLLAALAEGRSVQAAAAQALLSLRTAERRLHEARRQLGASTNAAAVRAFLAARDAL